MESGRVGNVNHHPEIDGSAVSVTASPSPSAKAAMSPSSPRPVTGVPNCNIEGAVWTSLDGSAWVRVQRASMFAATDPKPDQPTGASAVASFGSQFVIVGGYEGNGAAWIYDPRAK